MQLKENAIFAECLMYLKLNKHIYIYFSTNSYAPVGSHNIFNVQRYRNMNTGGMTIRTIYGRIIYASA